MNIFVDIKLIVLFHLICQLKIARSDFEDSQIAEDVVDTQEINESASEPVHIHRHRHVRRGSLRYKSRDHRHDHDHEHDHSHDHDHDDDYNDDCECACNKCDSPSDCCKGLCKSCPVPGQGPGQSHSSVLFVPYPYPMIMPNQIVKNNGIRQHEHGTMRAQLADTTPETPTTSTTTTTTTTTTSTTTTTTTERPETTTLNQINTNQARDDNKLLESVLKGVVDDYSNIIVKTPEKLSNGNNKFMLTSLRRTKPTWMPKFGIVPISDNIAEKLMLQLRRRGGPIRRQERVANYRI